ECARLQTSSGRSAEEGKGGAVVIAGHHRREGDVVDSGGDVKDVVPALASVVGDGDDRIVVVVGEGEVDAPALRDSDRGIAVRWEAVGYLADVPGDAIVLGDNHRLVLAAAFVRNVDRAVRRDLHVPVQAAASARIDGDRGPKGQPPVETQCAVRLGDVLRA